MKKNYGIDMQGPFRVQRVASLSAWNSEDIGREVYLTSNNKRYCGNNSAWVESDVDKIWTHQNTAPTGWSIISGTTDALLATKGGLNAYNVSGGTQAGTWTQLNHSHGISNHTHSTGAHTLTISEMPSHVHPVGYRVAQLNGGGGGNHIGDHQGNNQWQDSIATGGGGSHNHGNTGSNGPGFTNAGASAATYRPDANVGIVIERN